MIVEEERDFILFKKNEHNRSMYIKKDSNQKRSNYLDEGKPVKK